MQAGKARSPPLHRALSKSLCRRWQVSSAKASERYNNHIFILRMGAVFPKPFLKSRKLAVRPGLSKAAEGE